MSAYVDECRKEWKRLGVPELVAEEMATELEADLADAEADGVAAAELLGESDPRRFAANWARERGLIPEPSAQRRRRMWPWIVVGLILLLLLPTWLALQTVGSSSPPLHVTPVKQVAVPSVVGMKACKAVRVLARTDVNYWRTAGNGHGFPCDRVVVAQNPVGRVVKRGFHEVVVTLRLGPR
ncbi:MAG TPA: hypothetical protein VH541_08510 [Gaiellaceae bacterium]|jgi:hypothetical protein